MPVYVKVGNLGGGSWRQIADGNLRVKHGGGIGGGWWHVPTKCYVKIGDLGGGYWKDTGYASYPNPPTSIWVVAWNYGATHTAFYGPSSGPPVQDYHIERLDYWGNPVEGYYQTSGERVWSTPQDTHHQFRVRSRGVNGLHSDWSSPYLRVAIGHAATPNYGWVERARGWETYVEGGGRNANDPWWFYVPGRIYISGMHWRNLYAASSSVVTPGTNRTVNYIFNGGDYGPLHNNLGTIHSGHSYDYGLGNWSDGNWGIVPRGVGWSTTGNPYYQCHCDNIWLSGTEYYDSYEIVSWNPEQGNNYW